MDNHEAIASLKTLCHTCELFPRCAYEKPECFRAIEMAISALQAQDVPDVNVGGTISRQAAIEAAMEYGKKVPTYAIRVKNAIEALPPVQPELQWIPVSERLPKEGERVLCTHIGGLNPNKQVIEHIYQNGNFTMGWDMDLNPNSPTFGQRYMGTVIAWMPFPEPFKEVTEWMIP